MREEEARDLLGRDISEVIFQLKLHHHDEEGVFWWEHDLDRVLGLKEVECEEVPEP
jgi:hypothetical protein